ncbi:MAG: autotransporter assembly complex protein TamA [Burkholderiales bacterium]|jgi:translocation and assembly module TamA|nr:autotransporter assembly complex protein TamA [Burkholderiales bacterium]
MLNSNRISFFDFLWLFVAAIILSSCGAFSAQPESAAPSPEAPPSTLVKSYTIKLNASDVSDFLETYLDIFRAQSRSDLSEEELVLMTDRIPDNAQALLKTLGYFSSKTHAEVTSKGDHQWEVTIDVDAGEQVIVQEININVVGDVLNDQEALKRFENAKRWLWRLPKGAPFNQTDWNDSKQRVLNFFAARSYPTAVLKKSEAKINVENKSVALFIDIDTGHAYRFGAVTVQGFSRYPRAIADNRIPPMEGEPYRQNTLRDLQSDLQNLPYFNGVIVDAPPSETAPYLVPVTVTVDEAPRNKLDLSIGYSANNGARLLSQYNFYNVAARGWIFDNTLDLSKDKQEGEVGLSFPRHRSGYDYRIFGSYGDDDTQGWISHTTKFGAMRSKSKDNMDRSIVIEHIRENRHDSAGYGEILKATAVNLRWSRSTTLPRNNPRRGYYIQGEIGGAVRGLVTDESFLRLYGRGTQYFPIGERHVALARVEICQTLSEHPEKVPTSYLFRAGGSGSVRGYNYQALGIDRYSSVIPGRVLGTASLEYQHTLFNNWRGAVFVDYGDAANRWQDWSGKTGVGVGARWLSPVGVLGTDLAYGINDQKFRFYFSLGLSI